MKRLLLALLATFLFTFGTVAPVSAAPKEGKGANRSGDFTPTNPKTKDPSNDHGKRPSDGSVGNADDKNPPGQSHKPEDHNNGYECDGNNGVGKGNPAHSACSQSTPPTTVKDKPPKDKPPTTPPTTVKDKPSKDKPPTTPPTTVKDNPPVKPPKDNPPVRPSTPLKHKPSVVKHRDVVLIQPLVITRETKVRTEAKAAVPTPKEDAVLATTGSSTDALLPIGLFLVLVGIATVYCMKPKGVRHT